MYSPCVVVNGGGCLTEKEILDLLAGTAASGSAGRMEPHLGECDSCARVVAELARESGSSNPTWSERLRPRVLLPGTVVGGRYLIRRSLGVGAMGEVHEAEDRLLGKTVALKTLNARLTGEERALERLKAEVALAHKVTHPNVCRVFDLGVDEGAGGGDVPALLFLTMECLEGETLAIFLRRCGPLPPSSALALLIQIASGLAAAHAVGVVHRDLKGENVMLVARPKQPPRAVITDFGLAGSIAPNGSASADSRRFSGTLAYAAPERLAGRRATPASDVYSFGLLALEMLSGAVAGTDPAAPVRGAGRIDDERSMVRIAPASLGRDWDQLITRMTHPAPAQRFPDGQALVAALQAMTAAGSAPGAARWSRRPSVWLGGAALVVLVGAAGATTRRHAPVSVGPSMTPAAVPSDHGRPATFGPSAAARRVATPVLESEKPTASTRTGVTAPSARRLRARPYVASEPHAPPTPAVAEGPGAPLGEEASSTATADDIVRELPSGGTAARTGKPAMPDLVDPFRVGREAKPLGSYP